MYYDLNSDSNDWNDVLYIDIDCIPWNASCSCCRTKTTLTLCALGFGPPRAGRPISLICSKDHDAAANLQRVEGSDDGSMAIDACLSVMKNIIHYTPASISHLE